MFAVRTSRCLGTLPSPSHCTPQHMHIQVRQLALFRRYENWLERRYPRVYRVHRLIIDGCKECGGDIKNYYVVSRDLRQERRQLSSLSQTELLSFIQCPPELLKLVVLFVILQFPGPGDVLILSALLFPRVVLTRHFWTDEQKDKFWRHAINNAFKPQIREIVSHLNASKTRDLPLPVERVAEVKMPELNDLSASHLYRLFKLHRVSMLGGTSALQRHATVLHQLDVVMAADEAAAVDQLSITQLRNHFFVRRLDFGAKSEEQLREELRAWLGASSSLIRASETTFLHAPVFIQASNTR